MQVFTPHAEYAMLIKMESGVCSFSNNTAVLIING
jgi:hypothetical protein